MYPPRSAFALGARLLNSAGIELWPAPLLRARASADARILARGRLDGVIESAAVMHMLVQQLRLQDKIREAGCQQASPVYVGFSPRLPNAAQLVEHFDQGIAELRRSKRLARILSRYGQQDWKAD